MFSESGYDLFCNRDEKRTRLPAEEPREFAAEGVRYVAALDGDRRGTWLSVNELGVTVCLLNMTGGMKHAPVSRGHLVLRAAGASSPEDAMDRVASADLDRVAPFRVIALAPGKRAAVFAWDGQRAVQENRGEGLLVSSSFDPAGVERYRRTEFARLPRFDAETLRRFHASHMPHPCAYSPCMHRADAETVSFTHVRVGREVSYEYSPGAPCLGIESVKRYVG